MILLVQSAPADTDVWDLPPLRYSDASATDSLAKLAADLASGVRKLEGATGLDRLRFVLKELRVPEASQVLVFSKTSFQNPLIHPQNPRSLYFSEEAYVGYVPGGHIEAIVQDPLLGPVFYVIESAKAGGLKIQRDTSSCIDCHGTSNTEGVPGMQVRSVFSDLDGRPLFAMGTRQVNHETPLAGRWGSYYVTGRSSLPHLGNRTYVENGPAAPQPSDLPDLAHTLEVSKYLRPTSDIVALLVLEHQCRLHNLLNAATLQYRRAAYLTRALDPEADPKNLLALCLKVKASLAKIKLQNLDAAAARELLRTEVAPKLWKVSKCPDFVEDRGHYFGSELPDADKLAVIEYLKTL